MSVKLLLIFSIDNLNTPSQKEIYNEFYYLVYDMVLSIIRDSASVEDIIQESFLKAMHSPPEHPDPNKIKAWLKTVTKNKCLDYLRKHKKIRNELNTEHVNLDNTADISPNDSSIEKQVMTKVSVEEILEEVHRLKPAYKEVFILKYIHELNTKEISEIMDIPQPTVRQWVFRAKESIKKAFRKETR